MLKNLEDILITDELFRRTPRASNLQAENQALRALARQLVNQPQTMLQNLVDIALELCESGTAGVSLLEVMPNGEEVFRWNVLAGTLKQHVGATTPRNFSLCSICLDRGTPQLYEYPERYFTYFQAAKTPVVEGLVLPLIAENHALGTIWIMSHSLERRFDPEDVRVMTSLADFTAAALLSNRLKTQELIAKNAQLEIEISNRKLSEAQARESEERLRVMIENLPGGAVFVVDQNLRYLFAEGEALSIAGFKPEDLVGHRISEAMPPELVPKYEALYRSCLAGESFEYEHNAHGRSYISRGTPISSSNGEIYAVLAVSYDITDRKQLEAALRESEAKYRMLFETMDEGFGIAEIIFDHQDEPLDFRWLEVNPQFEHLTRLPREEVLNGKTIWQVAPNLEARWFQIYGHVAKCGEPIRFEQNSPSLGRWFEVYAFRIGAPQLRRVAVLFNDISKRKQAEAALRESEEHYRTLIKASSDIVYKMSADWSLMHNLVGKQFVASTVNPNRNWLEEYIPAYEQPFVQVAIDKAIRSKSNFELEYRIFRADGTVGWTFSRAIPLLDEQGEIVEWLGAASDVTERKKAEEALRESEETKAYLLRLSDALRPLSDPIEIQQKALKIVGEYLDIDRVMYNEIDPAVTEYTVHVNYVREGFSPFIGSYPMRPFAESVKNLRLGKTDVIYDVENEERFSEEEKEICRGINVQAFVVVPLIKKGQWVINLVAHYSKARNWTQHEVSILEETAQRTWAAVERARAEAAMRESEIQRIREQAAREEERQRAEYLAELDRAKTLFFSNISHEFRTPLTLLLAPLQDALSDNINFLSPPQRERIEVAHRNAIRLLKLVNTLLDFSRIEAGRIQAVYEGTDLAQLTTELASVFRSAIEQAGLRFIVDCPPLPEPVYIDREMWEKIVLNLLSNAFKFTLKGEIAVRLHKKDDQEVMLQVQDTGAGIKGEEIPRLFERFYQVRGTQARTHEGSGIGLALVHELVKLHGGKIDVSSTIGEGSCFTVTIPLGKSSQSAELKVLSAEKEEKKQYSALSTQHSALITQNSSLKTQNSALSTQHSSLVLLVDDNADMRDYLTRILSEHVTVEAVADGATALAVAIERVPDLILSDVMMPGLDGFELLKALRNDARTKEIPIILLSARAGEESVVDGLQALADDYLIKPFSASELVARVNAHLQMAQLRLEALQKEKTTNLMKDKLLAEVSHELNAPLVAILGWTRLLRSSPFNPAMLAKSLETIERNATLQAKLVQDLLDLSRITSGKISLNKAPVELQSVIEAAIATVCHSLETKDICLESILDPKSITIEGDSERLQQIVLNLLTNAIKFTPKGGRIVVHLGATSTQAQISVSDNGIGIEPEFLPHVFETFRQSQSSKGGLGLGLAIAHHLVELHGGAIYAESLGVGQGATFTVKLPLKAR